MSVESHYLVELRSPLGKWMPILSAKTMKPAKLSRSQADKQARDISQSVGRPAKVVLVKTIRSVIVAYRPKAVRNG